MRFVGITLILLCCAFAIIGTCGCAGRRNEVTLRADRSSAGWPISGSEIQKVMEQSRDVIQKRLNGSERTLGCAVRIEGEDKIVIDMLASTSNQAVTDAVERATAKTTLEFYHLTNVRSQTNPKRAWEIRQDTNAYIFTGPNGREIDSARQPALVLSKVVNTKANRPILTGKDILPNARADSNQRQQVVIEIEFNRAGAETFRDFTRENVGEYLAIFYDGKLLTAPTIQEPIPNGKAEITGFTTLAEAREATDALNSGALPVTFKVVKK